LVKNNLWHIPLGVMKLVRVEMIRLKSTISVFLLVAFLVTSLGSAFGFIVCEEGCFSDEHLTNHQSADIANDSQFSLGEQHDEVTDDHILNGFDSCWDKELKFDNYLSRNGKSGGTLSDNYILNLELKTTCPFTLFPVEVKRTNSLNPQLWVSQINLSHRTIVILV